MNSAAKMFATQLTNIQAKTHKSLEQLCTLIRDSGLARRGEIRAMLKRDLDLDQAEANTLVRFYFKFKAAGSDLGKASWEDFLRVIYAGTIADLHSIHEALMTEIARLGPFEIAPKKGYISLRRKRQFAILGPVTKTCVEVGLNLKGIPPTARLLATPSGSMCPYKVHVTKAEEVDEELVGWLRMAYDNAT